MADAFGTTVHGIVFQACRSAEFHGVGLAAVKVVIRMLQAFDASQPHHGGEIGVLAVGFHTAPPAWVAEDVDIRGEEGQSSVISVVAGVPRLLVFDSRFEGHVVKHAAHQ